MNKALQILIERLEAIAKKNNDKFVYRLNLRPQGDKLRYCFVCEEAADNHVFVSGDGDTIEAAVAETLTDIKGACESWGYKA